MPSRIRYTKASQVFEAFPELEEDIGLSGSDAAPARFVADLLEGDVPENAILFFAHLLPKRETVWWGARCVAGLCTEMTEEDSALLALAEAWVRDCNEANRARALKGADQARRKTPAAWIAYGAGWASGSLAPAGQPMAPMPPQLTAKAVNAGVLIAVAEQGQRQRAEAMRACIRAGLAFGEGGTMPTVTVKGQTAA